MKKILLLLISLFMFGRIYALEGSFSLIKDNNNFYDVKLSATKKVNDLTIKSYGSNNIKLSWKKVSGSVKYQVYRSTDKKKWKRIKTTKKNSFNNTKLKTNKTYYYKVRYYKVKNGKRKYSNFSNVIKSETMSKARKNAIKSVKNLLKFNYSKIEILSKLNYSKSDLNYAIKYLKINFNDNCFKTANLYLELFNLSKDELILSLSKDGFTSSEIDYSIGDISLFGENYFDENLKVKKDLYILGYSLDDSDILLSKISISSINKYLLSKKYNNLLDFINSKYFNISNINRYQNYYDKNKYNIDKTIMYVEIGLDNKFYSNMKKSNVKDGVLILVNKYNYINKNYNANLTKLKSGYGSGSLNKEAASYFYKMVDAAKKDGIKLKSVSAYRSYNVQKSLYKSYVKRDGVKKADTYSARAGSSEHQTGLAVDINTAASSANFQNTKEYKWLMNNSYKYGFIERYPKGKTNITGYKYEPWHYRYVGVDVASIIHENNITFEEYKVISTYE